MRYKMDNETEELEKFIDNLERFMTIMDKEKDREDDRHIRMNPPILSPDGSKTC